MAITTEEYLAGLHAGKWTIHDYLWLRDHDDWRTVTVSTPTNSPPTKPTTTGINLDQLANALYGKSIPLFAGGKVRFGGVPGIGPYITNNRGTFGIMLALPLPITGQRKIYEIAFDGKKAWTSESGGTVGADGTFYSETFTFRFYGGTTSQSPDSVETARFGSAAVAYRPMSYIMFEDLPFSAFGNHLPYVSGVVGDTTDGADPDDGINLGDALTRVAYWSGETSDTFETVGITDIVPALVLDSNVNLLQLLQQIAGEYRNLDIVQTDKLRVIDRGSTTTADIIVNPNWILGAGLPRIVRQDPSSVPRDRELTTIDPNADYTRVTSRAAHPRFPVVTSAAVGKDSHELPLVLDAATRTSLVNFAQWDEELARKKVTLTGTVRLYGCEPGDRVSLESLPGFDDDTYKIIEVVRGADYTVQITAQALMRCGVTITDDVPASGHWDENFKASGITLSSGNQTATSSGTDQVVLSDTPLLVDSYWEVRIDAKPIGNILLGLLFQSARLNTTNTAFNAIAGTLYNSSGLSSSPLNVTFTTGDRIGFAFSPSTGELWVHKNGTWLGNSPAGSSARTLAHAAGRCYFPSAAFTGSGNEATLIVDPESFIISTPDGFAPLATGARPDFKWNSADIGSNLTLSDNDTKITKASTGHSNVRLGIQSLSGKQVWAIKVTANAGLGTAKCVGVTDYDDSLSQLIGSSGFAVGYRSTGGVRQNGTLLQTYSTWGAVDDVLMIAADDASHKIWFGLNGSWNGDPGAGTGDVGAYPQDGSSNRYAFIAAGMTDNGDALQLIDWPYAVPSGFTAEAIA